MAKIPVTDATDAQIKAFLERSLGVPKIHPATKRETLLKKLAELHDGDTIEADDNVVSLPKEHAAAHQNARALSGTSFKDAPKVVVKIHMQDGPVGSQKVFLGVNARGMLVERDKPQPIPYPYYEVLANAVETQTYQNEDGEDELRHVQAYPFQVLSMPPEEEIRAWKEKARLADDTQLGSPGYKGTPLERRAAAKAVLIRR